MADRDTGSPRRAFAVSTAARPVTIAAVVIRIRPHPEPRRHPLRRALVDPSLICSTRLANPHQDAVLADSPDSVINPTWV